MEKSRGLIKHLLGDISEDRVESILSIPGQYTVGNWYRVMSESFRKERFGIYWKGLDFPSPKYYEDTLKHDPQDCKEFNGIKYIHFISDDSRRLTTSKFY